jgi:hypothetical protein
MWANARTPEREDTMSTKAEWLSSHPPFLYCACEQSAWPFQDLVNQ